MGFSWLGTSGGMRASTTCSRRRGRCRTRSCPTRFSSRARTSTRSTPTRCTRAFTSRSTATAADRARGRRARLQRAPQDVQRRQRARVVGSAQAGAVHRRDGVSVYVRRDRRVEAVQKRGRRLAAKTDWPVLYDVDALARCDAPVACASYVEDMFVDFDLATETASRIGRTAPGCGPRASTCTRA